MSKWTPNTYHAVWHTPTEIERWVWDELVIGECLVFPKGGSNIGHVQADVDPTTFPDVIADFYNPPFPAQSFDTVYCDPPFEYLVNQQRAFIPEILDLARQRVIFQTDRSSLSAKRWEKSFYIAELNFAKVYKTFQVFDRPDTTLEAYSGATAAADGGFTEAIDKRGDG